MLPFSLKRLRALLRERGRRPADGQEARDGGRRRRSCAASCGCPATAEATVVLTRVAGAQTVLLVEPVPR